MKTLFVDTATSDLTVSVVENNKYIYMNTIAVNSGHSNALMPEIEKAFLNSNINTVDKFMVISGPGSFTGLRIGITVLKTLAWSLNKKVIPISTLKALAISSEEADYYVSLIDARHNCVYAGIYDSNYNEVLEEKYYSIDAVNSIVNKLTGIIKFNGDILLDGRKNEYLLNPLKIIEFYLPEEGITAHAVVPNYLKKHEAEENLDGNN